MLFCLILSHILCNNFSLGVKKTADYVLARTPSLSDHFPYHIFSNKRPGKDREHRRVCKSLMILFMLEDTCVLNMKLLMMLRIIINSS